jgi:predicted nucleic acid-binding protein
MAGAGEARPPFPRRAFCDTSYFYACADAVDGHHRRALALASNAAIRRTELWTTCASNLATIPGCPLT